MRCPGGARALEKEEKDPLPGCLQESPARDFGGVEGHWTKYQQAPSGGRLPKTQSASGLIVSYHLILGFGTGPGPPVAFQCITFTVATEGRSNLCPKPCSAAVRCMVDELCPSSFSVPRAARQRLLHEASWLLTMLRLEFSVPGFFSGSAASLPLELGIKCSVLCELIPCYTLSWIPPPPGPHVVVLSLFFSDRVSCVAQVNLERI